MDKPFYKTRLRTKGQITVPPEVRTALGVKEGDDLLFSLDEQGRVVISRAQMIPPEQAWFWSKRWQDLEREAQADIDAGRVVEYQRRPMPHLTLTTDFGTRQGSQSVMHGVIYSICPGAVITDLTHEITPFQVMEAGFLLSINAFYFPEGTVHVAVVDPGVGTRRRPIAARVGAQVFVAPDNGLLSWVYAKAEKEGLPVQVVHLDRPEYWLPRLTRTFHGRDLFAPAAAHLACGVPLEQVGTPVDDPVRLPIPGVQPIAGGVEGEVVYIDPFGSAIISILPEDIAPLGQVQVRLCGVTIPSMVDTFGDRPLYGGELIALWDSSGYLYVSENNGTGGTIIQPKVGDKVQVTRRA